MNVEAVVEGLLPWLKEDISSSESYNPRTPSPDIEVEEIFEFEEAAQIDPELEQLNIRPGAEDESDEVDTEHPPTLNLEIKDDKGQLRIAYQNYLSTGGRIAAIGGRFKANNNLDPFLPRDVFRLHPGPEKAQAELDLLITIIAWQRTLAEHGFSRIV